MHVPRPGTVRLQEVRGKGVPGCTPSDRSKRGAAWSLWGGLLPLLPQVWVYGLKTLSLMDSIETTENPKGQGLKAGVHRETLGWFALPRFVLSFVWRSHRAGLSRQTAGAS